MTSPGNRYEHAHDNCARKVLRLMSRRRYYDDNILDTQLKRCLKTAEIAFFGIANMIGAGIFVLTGKLITIAGPAGVLSYILAGISGILAGLCYAELATMLPKAGSCYTFTYYTIGELFAFIIGWTMISDCIVGFAAVTKAFSAALDAITGNRISNGTITLIGSMNVPALASYPDFVAFGLILLIVAIIASGAKDSMIVSAVCTSVLLALLAIIIVSTYVFGSNWAYWTAPQYGGFMPYGFSGVLQGASICVFAFAGFDTIANTSEEARSPKFSIPRAMAIALVVVAVVYCSACAGLSLMVNKDTVNIDAPFTYAFLQKGQIWLYYLSAVATMISTSDVSGMYVLPRMLYAMATDGLLFPFFAYVTGRTKVPIWSLLIGGLITALMALLIDLSSLADMTSIGMLLSYSTVGINALIIRYNGMGNEIHFNLPKKSKKGSQDSQKPPDTSGQEVTPNGPNETFTDDTISPPELYPRFRSRFQWMSRIVRHFGWSERLLCAWCIWIYVIGSILLAVMFTFAIQTSVIGLFWFVAVFLIPLSTLAVVMPLLILYTFKANRKEHTFQLPLMPVIPCVTIIVNTFLIMTIQDLTWVRFLVWTAIGLIIYFAYGIRHSTAGKRNSAPASEPQRTNEVELPNYNNQDSPATDAAL